MRAAALAVLVLCSSARASELGDFEKRATQPDHKNEDQEYKAGRDAINAAADAVTTPPDMEDSSGSGSGGALMLLLFPLAPYAVAQNQDKYGYVDYPYTPSDKLGTFAYGKNERAQRVEATYQRVSDAIGGLGARYRLLSKSRIGLDASWTRYRERYNRVDLNIANADVTAAVYQDDPLVGWYGLGVAMLSGHRTNAGPDARVGVDWYPLKPLSFETSVGVSIIDGNGLGDFRVGAGVSVWRAQLRLGYRALFAVTSHLSGPEASLGIWF